ncbi:hypothetical protein NMG60_11032496 [Bertholletia excelsa]
MTTSNLLLKHFIIRSALATFFEWYPDIAISFVFPSIIYCEAWRVAELIAHLITAAGLSIRGSNPWSILPCFFPKKISYAVPK